MGRFDLNLQGHKGGADDVVELNFLTVEPLRATRMCNRCWIRVLFMLVISMGLCQWIDSHYSLLYGKIRCVSFVGCRMRSTLGATTDKMFEMTSLIRHVLHSPSLNSRMYD